jgi:hypothetical protein
MRLFIPIAMLSAAGLFGQAVAVRQTEGELRGFLVLRSANGTLTGNEDSMQTTRGGQIVYHSVIHFKDGSVQDETTVFTQNGHFQLVSDHLVQKGPAFKHPVEMTIDTASGQVTVVHADDKGEAKSESEHMDLPPDLANGIVPILLKNLRPADQAVTESMVVATPKPMLIKLQIHAEGEDSFTAGSLGHKATRYNVHVDIGGIKGALADLLGKEPPDTRVWILQGECPTFVRAEGPVFAGGPVWRTELVSPVFPANMTAAATREKH